MRSQTRTLWTHSCDMTIIIIIHNVCRSENCKFYFQQVSVIFYKKKCFPFCQLFVIVCCCLCTMSHHTGCQMSSSYINHKPLPQPYEIQFQHESWLPAFKKKFFLNQKINDGVISMQKEINILQRHNFFWVDIK